MLKRIRIVVPVLTGMVLLASASRSSQAQGLYAVSGAGNATSVLYRLDPTNGSVLQTIGATGFNHVTALAFDPTSGALYGHVSDTRGSGTTDLISINPLTGAGSIIGSTGQQVPDMSFNPSGQLYSWSESGDVLESIDKTTGVATQIGSNNVGTSNTGFAFNSTGTLYLKPGSQLYTVDPATGLGTFVENLSANLANSLAFDANDNLFSVSRPSGASGPSFLETIDIGTGNVTELGDIGVSGISALAFQSGATATPEPGSLALMAGAALSGSVFLRRRKRAHKAA